MSTTLLQLALCGLTTIKHSISGKSKYVFVSREKMRNMSRDLRYYKAQNANYYKDIMKANMMISDKDNVIRNLEIILNNRKTRSVGDEYVKQLNRHGDTIYYRIDSHGKKMRVPASLGSKYVND